jgi:AraC-like DNA-binding protein
MLSGRSLAVASPRTMTPWAKSLTPGCSGAAVMAEPTVGAGYARGLMELALAKGASRALLAERSGVALADLQDQDARLPLSSYVALMRAGKALSGDPALGLHYGEAVDLSEVSIVGLIGQAAATPMEGFRQLNRYVRLIVETDNEGGGDRFRMTARDGGLWMIDTRRHAEAFPELTETAFAQFVSTPRRLGLTPPLKAVHVTHSDPGYRDEYERIFGAPVTFDADWNGLQIDPTWAPRDLARMPKYVFGVLSERADALLADLETVKSVRGRVESLLMPILHTGEVSMDRIARELGMSRQTLFRRLRAEGVTFEAVLDELRHRLAVHYLSGKKVSVNETAYLVGFSDPAPFSRAFKRWTGSSPRMLRAS